MGLDRAPVEFQKLFFLNPLIPQRGFRGSVREKTRQDDIVVFVWVRTQQRRDRQRRVIASTQENTSTTTTTRSCNNLLWHFHFRCEMFRNDNCLSANSYQIPMILWVVFLGGWEARWSDWDLMNNVLREFDLMWRQIAFLFSVLSPMHYGLRGSHG